MFLNHEPEYMNILIKKFTCITRLCITIRKPLMVLKKRTYSFRQYSWATTDMLWLVSLQYIKTHTNQLLIQQWCNWFTCDSHVISWQNAQNQKLTIASLHNDLMMATSLPQPHNEWHSIVTLQWPTIYNASQHTCISGTLLPLKSRQSEVSCSWKRTLMYQKVHFWGLHIYESHCGDPSWTNDLACSNALISDSPLLKACERDKKEP